MISLQNALKSLFKQLCSRLFWDFQKWTFLKMSKIEKMKKVLEHFSSLSCILHFFFDISEILKFSKFFEVFEIFEAFEIFWSFFKFELCSRLFWDFQNVHLHCMDCTFSLLKTEIRKKKIKYAVARFTFPFLLIFISMTPTRNKLLRQYLHMYRASMVRRRHRCEILLIYSFFHCFTISKSPVLPFANFQKWW